MAVAGQGRSLFIDDGGESSTLPMMTALCLDTAVVARAEALTATRQNEQRSFIPAFVAPEWHGIRLARRVTPSERESAATTATPLLHDYERAFIYRDTLHHLGGLPGHARIYTVSMRAIPAGTSGVPKGTDVRDITRGLLEYVLEHEETPVTSATIDRGDQFRHHRAAFDEAAGDYPHQIACSLVPVQSQASVMVQLADMACYSAYKLVKPDPPKSKQRHRGIEEWYEEALSELFPVKGSQPQPARRIRR